MKISVQENGTKDVLVYVEGEIDAYTAPELKEKLNLLTEKFTKITVDLANVEYMDSTGLGVFIGVMKMAKKHGSLLVLTNMLPRVRRLFDITGLDEVIKIEGDSQGDEKV